MLSRLPLITQKLINEYLPDGTHFNNRRYKLTTWPVSNDSAASRNQLKAAAPTPQYHSMLTGLCALTVSGRKDLMTDYLGVAPDVTCRHHRFDVFRQHRKPLAAG